jgi:tRNA threonylcarbamoyladenosine biosynthesis protein TsaB
MARAIAIETSGRVGSIALWRDKGVLSEQTFPHGLKHAAEIIPIIDTLCRAQGWGPKDVQEVYLSAGPGSFTGLRIAVTLAKTMALATGVKLVAVPSVRVLAENAPAGAKHLLIVLDAKRDQIYTARFERVEGRWVEREGAHLDRLAEAIERAPRPVHLLGEGLPYHEKFVPKEDGVIVCGEENWRARASVVAELGAAMAARGEYADPDRLTPIYIRPPEAQEKWEQRFGADGAAGSPQ